MRTGLEEIAELVDVVERAAVETTERLLTDMGMVHPPTVHVLSRLTTPQYIGSVGVRRFYPGADAARAVTGLGWLPSVLYATHLVVVWEHADLCAALEVPGADHPCGVVVLDASMQEHTVRWHPWLTLMREALDDAAARLLAVVWRVAGSGWTAGRTAVLHGAALVCLARAVLDERPAVTARAASPELGVELLEQARCHLPDRLIAERRIEVHARILLVASPSGRFDIVRPQPGLHRDAERRVGLGVPLLVDLRAEALEYRLRLRLCPRRRGEPELLAREWVVPGVDQHLERVAPLADMPT